MPYDEAAVTDALTAAVRDLGSDVACDPRRVQGLLVDILGAEARSHRAEVDAVVLAAEEAIPEDLLGGRLDPAEGAQRLRDRGIDDRLARFAIDSWSAALGLPASVEPSAPPIITTPTSTVPATTEPSITPVVVTTSARTGRQTGWWLAGAAVVAAVAVVVGLVLTNTDSTPPPSTHEVAFRQESTTLGRVSRKWKVSDGTLVGTVTIRNATDKPVSGRHFEVVPKSLARTAAAISSSPTHTVVQDDPVIAWDVELDAGRTFTATYRVKVAATVDQKRLDTWQRDRTRAAREFDALRSKVPSLTVTSPADGAQVPNTGYDVVGVTDPTATVTVDGNAVPVNADGTWTYHVATATPVSIVATSPLGAVATKQLTVTPEGIPPVAPPPDVTTTLASTTTVATKQCPNGAVVAASATCPSQPTTKLCPNGSVIPIKATCPTTPRATTTAPTTSPPPVTVKCWNGTTASNQAACPPTPISVSVSGPTTIVTDGSCSFAFTLAATGFTPSAIDWPYGSTWDNKTTAHFTFQQPTDFTYTSTITVVATAPDGRTTSDSISVDVIAPPPSGFSC